MSPLSFAAGRPAVWLQRRWRLLASHCERSEATVQPPLLVPSDVVALSFVYHLSPAVLYPLLRGEPPLTRKAPRLPFESGSAYEPAAPPDGPLSLETVLAQAGCPGDAGEVAAAARDRAARAVVCAATTRLQLVPWGDARYPALLAQIFDPPLVLWVRGDVTVLDAPLIVALVGSRAASPYGEQAAARLASELAMRGIVVVSGMARGIDAAAHRGALAASGRSIAVLGCGADVAYPPEHAALAAELASQGAVVSEFPPGTPPISYNFPKRNRIISGMSRGVVVVEAWQHSGALITANCALDQGREVMAVPGNVLSERHRGSHTLLKCGAALVETAQDVFDALRHVAGASLDGLSAASLGAGHAQPGDPMLDAMEAGDACDLDTLAARANASVAALLPRLLELELRGLVRRLPGGRFVRTAQPSVPS
jgi:DNA processing protein